ncbi:hypothetical protein SAMN04489761_0603 [Tenacibaculum sp. MAR_2009_124]|nr:hypothetical protein SAMN04489761_0603 [Tenacibaculum sp. MAR_2009_124]
MNAQYSIINSTISVYLDIKYDKFKMMKDTVKSLFKSLSLKMLKKLA